MMYVVLVLNGGLDFKPCYPGGGGGEVPIGQLEHYKGMHVQKGAGIGRLVNSGSSIGTTSPNRMPQGPGHSPSACYP